MFYKGDNIGKQEMNLFKKIIAKTKIKPLFSMESRTTVHLP